MTELCQRLPKVTAETFVVPLEEKRYLIYAPLRQTACVGNARVVNHLMDCKEGRPQAADPAYDDLRNLFRVMGILDAGAEPKPITRFKGTPEPTEVALFLTTACNLRCTYCYAQAGDTAKKFMKPDVACRGIEFVARNAARLGRDRFAVIYHGGGEPTVNWPTLTESHAFATSLAKELGIAFSSSTATNGVLRDSQIDWIISHLNGASVSFDGSPELQDEHRPKVGGGGSSSQVIHTLTRFDEGGLPYGIRVTVTADHIPHLVESVKFICSRFKPKRLQVEPAYQMGRWKDAPSAETDAFIEAFREAQVAARALGQEIYFSGAKVGHLSNHFCGVTQDSFSLSPDGGVSGCFEVFAEDEKDADIFFYGHTDNNGQFQFNKKRLANLRSQTVDRHTFCSTCFAKWNCGGDCYNKSLKVNGSTEFQGSDRCHVIRELTKDQILERIAKSGGLAWLGDDEPQEGKSAGKEFLL